MNVISATFECTLPFFSRFRNSEDRRNFISAGAAAGIASAFGAPVGGLLFAMEEVSSFWKNKLSWQVFFCCMVATFTTDLLNSAFHGFKYKGDFGLFKPKFIPKDLIAVNVIAVIPAILLGIVGGILGSAFTQLNLLISRTRKRLMVRIKTKVGKNLVRMLETLGVLVIVSCVHIFVPALIGKSDSVTLPLYWSPPVRLHPHVLHLHHWGPGQQRQECLLRNKPQSVQHRGQHQVLHLPPGRTQHFLLRRKRSI